MMMRRKKIDKNFNPFDETLVKRKRSRKASRKNNMVVNKFDTFDDEDIVLEDEEIAYSLHDIDSNQMKFIIDTIVTSPGIKPAQVSEVIASYIRIMARLSSIKLLDSFVADMISDLKSSGGGVNISNLNAIKGITKYYKDGLANGKLYEAWQDIPNSVEKHVEANTGLVINTDDVSGDYEKTTEAKQGHYPGVY